MNPELVLEIEAAAKDAKQGHGGDEWWGEEFAGDSLIQTDGPFVSLCSPANILALITEMRRMEGDLDAAVEDINTLRAENTRLRAEQDRDFNDEDHRAINDVLSRAALGGAE